MMGPDGAIQTMDHLIPEPPFGRPKTPFCSEPAYEDSEAFQQTDTGTGSTDTDTGTDAYEGADQDEDSIPGTGTGTGTGTGMGAGMGAGVVPSLFQLHRARLCSDDGAMRGLPTDLPNNISAAFITPNETTSGMGERSLKPGRLGVSAQDATMTTAFNLTDITPQDDENCDAEAAGPRKHLSGLQNHGMSSAIQGVYGVNSLELPKLKDASVFFCAPPEAIRKGIILPGTCQSLALPQLAFIFQFLNKSLDRRCQPQGQLLGDTKGKMYGTLGLIAVICLLVLSQSHVTKWPEQHNATGSAVKAPSKRRARRRTRWGSNVCASMGNRYLRRVLGGLYIVLCPPSSVDLLVAVSTDCFLPEVTPRGCQQKDVFAEVVSWRGGRLVSYQLFRSSGKCLDAVTTCKLFPPSQLMVGVTADTRELPAYTVQQAFREPSGADAVRRLREDLVFATS